MRLESFKELVMEDGPDLWPAILIGIYVLAVTMAPAVFVAIPLFVLAMLIIHAVK